MSPTRLDAGATSPHHDHVSMISLGSFRQTHRFSLMTYETDMDKLLEWFMKFNISKCKVMHMGHFNSGGNFTMGGVMLEKNKCENKALECTSPKIAS